MRARLSTACLGVAALAAAGSSSGCSPGGDSPSASTLAETAEVRTVPVPPERLSPFCQAIADLEEELAAAPSTTDTSGVIIDAYSAMVDDVPPEILDDFLTVLAGLQSGEATDTVPTTSPTLPAPPPTSARPTAPPSTVEDFEEGYTPDDEAPERLNAYIQFACHDSQNNPGPADTQPEPPPASSTVAP